MTFAQLIAVVDDVGDSLNALFSGRSLPLRDMYDPGQIGVFMYEPYVVVSSDFPAEQPIPEPATLGLLSLSCLALIPRKRK